MPVLGLRRFPVNPIGLLVVSWRSALRRFALLATSLPNRHYLWESRYEDICICCGAFRINVSLCARHYWRESDERRSAQSDEITERSQHPAGAWREGDPRLAGEVQRQLHALTEHGPSCLAARYPCNSSQRYLKFPIQPS